MPNRSEPIQDSSLAAFDRALAELIQALAPEYLDLQPSFPLRLRRTVEAMIVYCDEHPAAGELLFLQALLPGARPSRRRAQILRSAAQRLHADASHLAEKTSPSPFAAQFAVQAVAGVLHNRILEPTAEPTADLIDHLTATLLLPYLGRKATAQHLETSTTSDMRSRTGSDATRATEPKRASEPRPVLSRTPIRLTGRTLMVLRAVAENPGASNRPIGVAAGISDAGQTSKLLKRLQSMEWLTKTSPAPGQPNAWWITLEGTAVLEIAIDQMPTHATSTG